MNPLRLTLAAVLFVPTLLHAQQLDLVIRNGSVLDGSGSPAVHADIGILGDRIVLIEPHITGPAKRTIDATGLIVTPGFINAALDAAAP